MKRTSSNADLNTLLHTLTEFLDLVGRAVTIYELWKFFKKRRFLMLKSFKTFIGFLIFANMVLFLTLKKISPKRLKEVLGVNNIFAMPLVRKATIQFFFSFLFRLPAHFFKK